jgi:hypothetical protein
MRQTKTTLLTVLFSSVFLLTTAAAQGFPTAWHVVSPAPVASMPRTRCLAPDVQRLDDGAYRMYFTVTGRGVGSAVSRDGEHWTVEPGLRVTSRRHEADYRDGQLGFDLGHPWLVRLDDGRWRMYMQANTGLDTPLHIVSAVSDDAYSFEFESGERMPLGADTGIRFAGHGRAWLQAPDTWAMVFSGNTFQDRGPSDIILALSRDGLQWDIGDAMVYEDGHDPAVIRMPDGRMAIVYMYLKEGLFAGFSADGLEWSEPVALNVVDAQGRAMNEHMSDVALYRLPDGALRMLTNNQDGIIMLAPDE